MKQLTKEQGIIITGFTGKLACKFSDFHADIEKRLGRPVFTHELAYLDMKKIYEEDFLKLVEANKDVKDEKREKE